MVTTMTTKLPAHDQYSSDTGTRLRKASMRCRLLICAVRGMSARDLASRHTFIRAASLGPKRPRPVARVSDVGVM
jgi:hypothetical protein